MIRFHFLYIIILLSACSDKNSKDQGSEDSISKIAIPFEHTLTKLKLQTQFEIFNVNEEIVINEYDNRLEKSNFFILNKDTLKLEETDKFHPLPKSDCRSFVMNFWQKGERYLFCKKGASTKWNPLTNEIASLNTDNVEIYNETPFVSDKYAVGLVTSYQDKFGAIYSFEENKWVNSLFSRNLQYSSEMQEGFAQSGEELLVLNPNPPLDFKANPKIFNIISGKSREVLKPCTSPHSQHSLWTENGIFVVGGYPEPTCQGIIDPKTLKWKSINESYAPKGGKLLSYNNKLIVISKFLHVYDPKKDEWKVYDIGGGFGKTLQIGNLLIGSDRDATPPCPKDKACPAIAIIEMGPWVLDLDLF